MDGNLSRFRPDWVSLRQAIELLLDENLFPIDDAAYAQKKKKTSVPEDDPIFVPFVDAIASGKVEAKGQLGLVQVLRGPIDDLTDQQRAKIIAKIRSSDGYIIGLDHHTDFSRLSAQHWQVNAIAWERDLLIQWESIRYDSALLRGLNPGGFDEQHLIDPLVAFLNVKVAVSGIERFIGGTYEPKATARNWGPKSVAFKKRKGKKGVNELPEARWSEVFAYIRKRMSEGANWNYVTDIYGEVNKKFWKNAKKPPEKDTFRQKIIDSGEFGDMYIHFLSLQRRRNKLILKDNIRMAGN